MPKILLSYLFLFSSVVTAQSVIHIADDMEMVFVNNLPDNRKPKAAEDLLFVYQYEPATLFFGYKTTDSTFKVIAKFTEDVEGFNSAKSDSEFKNDTIVLWSQYPFKASESTYRFTWNGKRMNYLSVTYFDPSEEAIAQAERALSQGKIQETIDNYMGVQYPASYMNEDYVGFEILSKAHTLALNKNNLQQYKEAASYMDTALTFFTLQYLLEVKNEEQMSQIFEDRYITEYKDSFAHWMGNYGYFLYKADSLQKSVEVNEWINQVFPQLSGPYLQRADALYKQGKKPEAKKIYLIYLSLMKEKERDAQVPQRVHDRVK